jgi:putative RecB family exonuclease
LSASALEAFEESPARYLKEHVFRLTEEDNAYASFGTCVHQVLQSAFSAYKADETFDIEESFKTCWNPEGYENAETAATWYKDGLEAVTKYLTSHKKDPAHLLETGIQLKLQSGVKIVGKVDRIDALPDGSLEVIDYKTGRKDAKPADVKSNLPLALYAAALKQQGKQVARISLHYVMTETESSLAVSESFITQAISRAEELVAQILEAHATGHFPDTAPKYR